MGGGLAPGKDDGDEVAHDCSSCTPDDSAFVRVKPYLPFSSVKFPFFDPAVLIIVEEGKRNFEHFRDFDGVRCGMWLFPDVPNNRRNNELRRNRMLIEHPEDFDLFRFNADFLVRFAKCRGDKVSVFFVGHATWKGDLSFVGIDEVGPFREQC